MSKLRAPLKELLDTEVPEAQVQRMWRAVNREPSRRWRWSLLGAGVAFGLSAALWLLVSWNGVTGRRLVEGPLQLAGGAPLTAADAIGGERALTLALNDGSRVKLAERAQLTVLENTAHAFALQLVRGRTQIEVTPGGPRRWRVECGVASVEVVGTGFWVERDARGVRVTVAHGVVLVRSARVGEPVRRLGAGESVFVSSDDGAPSAEPRRGTSVIDGSRGELAPDAGSGRRAGADAVSGDADRMEAGAARAGLAAVSGDAAKRTDSIVAGAARAGLAAVSGEAASRTGDKEVRAAREGVAAESGVVARRMDGKAAHPHDAAVSSHAEEPAARAHPRDAAVSSHAEEPAPRAHPRDAAVSSHAEEPAARARPADATASGDVTEPPSADDPADGAKHGPDVSPVRAPVAAISSSNPAAATAPRGDAHAGNAEGLARLLDAADAARRAHAPERAAALLERVIREAPGSAHAAIASLTLARMRLERDPSAAAAAISDALAAALPNGLREDAAALLVEAHARAGERDQAVTAARTYLARYPDGRRAQEVKRWARLP